MFHKRGHGAAEALDGVRGGIRGIKGGGGRLAGRMGISRSPADRIRTGLPGRGWSGILAVFAALGAAALYYYFRKRRQVAEHYNMGEGERPWEDGGFRNFEATGAVRP